MKVTVRILSVVLLAGLLAPGAARAQGFVSASVGTAFGTPFEDCGSIADCQVRRSSYGFTVGLITSVFGTELEVTHTPQFLGKSDVLKDQSVTTVMQALVLKLPTGPVQPYGVVGFGVLHTSVKFDTAAFTSLRDSSLAWVVGGGVQVMPSRHVGLRAELRHYRPTGGFEIPALSLKSTTFDYSRASVGLLVRF
jgi:opacity protein-like surface antigen